MRADPRQRCLRRLLHYVAELSGDGQPSLAGVRRRFEEQHVAAHRGERESRGHTRLGGALAHLAFVATRAEPGTHAPLVDAELLRAELALGNLSRRLAQHVAESTLEISDTCL